MASIAASLKLPSPLFPSCFRQFSLSSPSSALSSFSPKPSFPSLRRFPTIQRPPTLPKIFALTGNKLKVGDNIEVNGFPWKVMEVVHVKPAKGAPYVRATLRNYLTGRLAQESFLLGSEIKVADIYLETKQYAYKDGNQYVFKDPNTYEEFQLSAAEVGDKAKWLKEGMDCNFLFWKGKWYLLD